MSSPFARQVLIVSITVAILAAPIFIMAESMNSGGAPNGRTGAPGESNCTACHASYAVNSGNGSFSIKDLPTYYIPGKTYTVKVEIKDPGQQKWGFELTAKDAQDGGAGTFTITDAVNTQKSNTSPDYVKQKSAGTYAGTADGPVSWAFDWTAPSSVTGTITFYAAGNAANNDGGTSGDYIYTASHAMTEAPSPPIPVTTTVGMIILAVMILFSGLYIYRRRLKATA